jgi:hypothetical protein
MLVEKLDHRCDHCKIQKEEEGNSGILDCQYLTAKVSEDAPYIASR